MQPADIIGTWRLVDYEIVAPDGHVSRPFGPGPFPGEAVFHPNGTIAVLLILADPQSLRRDAPATERAAALNHCASYVARWEIKGDELHHHVLLSLIPEWTGTVQVRQAKLDGDRLTLSPPPNPKGNIMRLVWQRVPP